MNTIKLYDEDAYMKSFTAKVLCCEKQEDGYALVLDKTCFFPEQGGQSPDKGSISGANVLDVQIKDEVVTHIVDREFDEGNEVYGEIDWNHRFSNMQQHTGEHIFSGITHKLYGYENVGFHLSDQIVTMDFDGPLSANQIKELEYLVNEAIAANVPITATFPTKEELEHIEYRSKKELEGQIRIVTIEGYDACACCAPHVARTGEVGGFMVQSFANYKGGMRISMLCGFRALEAARKNAATISELMDELSTNQDNIINIVRKQKANIQTLSYELGEARRELMLKSLSDIEDEEDVIIFTEGVDSKTIREVVNELVKSHEGYCGIFSANDTDTYNYVIASENKDCKIIAEKLRENLGAKGGGSPKMIQGSVNGKKELIRAIF